MRVALDPARATDVSAVLTDLATHPSSLILAKALCRQFIGNGSDQR